MSRIDYFTSKFQVESDLMRAVVLGVCKNYVKEANLNEDSQITLQESSWILHDSLNVIDLLLSNLIDNKTKLDLTLGWDVEFKDKDIIINQINSTKNKFSCYLGVVPFDTDFVTMSLIEGTCESIEKELVTLKKKVAGADWLGIKSILDGNVVDYLIKVKYILDKCKKY